MPVDKCQQANFKILILCSSCFFLHLQTFLTLAGTFSAIKVKRCVPAIIFEFFDNIQVCMYFQGNSEGCLQDD